MVSKIRRDTGMGSKRGGRRAGAGRPKNNPPTKVRCIHLTDNQVKLLRLWGRGDVSAGARWLIDAAAPIVHRAIDK